MSSEEQDWNYRGNYGQPVDPLPQVTLAIGHHNSGTQIKALCQANQSTFWTIFNLWPMACRGLWPLALSQGSHSYHVVPLHLPLYIQVGLTNMNGGIELGFEIWLYRYTMIDLDGNNKV